MKNEEQDENLAAKIRAAMKAKKITGADLASQFSKSSSWINNILRGNYPWYQGFGMPRYMHSYFESVGISTEGWK